MERNQKIRNIALVGVGLIALLFAFGGVTAISERVSVSPEAKHYAEHTLVDMDSAQLTKALEDNRGSVTMVFLYASWCPYCKKQFPMLDAIKMRYPNDLKIEYVSLDNDQYALSTFLMGAYPALPFTPYHVSGQSREGFDNALKAYEFTPDGKIPHLLLFDKSGNPVREFRGLTPIPQILEALKPLV